MTGLFFLVALALLPVLGLAIARHPATQTLSHTALIAGATVAGALGLTAEMFLLHLLRIRWSIAVLSLPLMSLSVLACWRTGRFAKAATTGFRAAIPGLLLAIVTLSLTTYAVATARATSADLLLFWGPKGQRFAEMRGIDLHLLRSPENHLMHPDYPPLLPFLYAWGAIAVGRFPWGAALFTLPLFLGLTLLAFWGFAHPHLGYRRTAEFTVLLAALLGYGLAVSLSAGNAEPALLFFETAGLLALTFHSDQRHGEFMASLALAAAVLTKVEGAVFAGLVAFCFALTRRTGRAKVVSASRILAAPVIVFAIWSLWTASENLTDFYTANNLWGHLFLYHWQSTLVAVLTCAAANVGFLHWIVLGVLIGIAPGRRCVGPLLAVCAGYIFFILLIYFRSQESPHDLIGWSAPRLLLTPMVTLFVAAAAAAVRRSSHGG